MSEDKGKKARSAAKKKMEKLINPFLSSDPKAKEQRKKNNLYNKRI